MLIIITALKLTHLTCVFVARQNASANLLLSYFNVFVFVGAVANFISQNIQLNFQQVSGRCASIGGVTPTRCNRFILPNFFSLPETCRPDCRWVTKRNIHREFYNGNIILLFSRVIAFVGNEWFNWKIFCARRFQFDGTEANDWGWRSAVILSELILLGNMV